MNVLFWYILMCFILFDVTKCHVCSYANEVNNLYFSLQSDFLLIVLKNLVEKRSNEQGRKLKVILM
jgi:hypothetical protein